MPNDKEFELDDLESFSFDDLSLDDEPPAVPGETGEDPFGVWVKSAPEDIGPADPLQSGTDSLPEDDFLSSEELAELDDSFDFVTVGEAPLEGESLAEEDISFLEEDGDTPAPETFSPAEVQPVPGQAAADSSGAPAFDEISLDDFVSFDDVTGDTVPETTLRDDSPAGADALEDELNEDFLDIDIDIEDEINDEELEIIEGAQPRADLSPETGSSAGFTAQDVDLSEFGDFEEVAPVQEEAEALEPLEPFEPIEAAASLEPDPVLTQDEGFFEETVLEDPDLDLSDLPDLDIPVDAGAATEEELLSEEITVFDDTPQDPLDLEPDDQTDLEHLRALEEDLTSGIREQGQGPAQPVLPPATESPRSAQEQTSDLAALILGKIEQELSSIKQEISDLKREVTHLRVAPPAAEAPVQSPAAADDAPDAAKGFFDEEDDETIALTGDELDNLLSTAEISEGEEPGLDVEEDLLDLDGEGNLAAHSPEPEPEAVHVTDEEFFAGTALDLNGPDPVAQVPPQALEEDISLGIPDSIELEEGLPEGLNEDETEDLLAEPAQDFEVDPLPEGLLEGQPEILEIPFDDEIALDLASPAADETPAVEDDWSPAGLEDESEELLSETFEAPSLSREAQEPSVPALPPVPQVDPAGAATGDLSQPLREQLKEVLDYMDKLLAFLPDEKIQEFAESEHFEVYKKLFEELGLME